MSRLPNEEVILILGTRRLEHRTWPGVVMIGTTGPIGISGVQGASVTIFDTEAEMNATTGTESQVAYCTDCIDQYWKWSVLQNKWVPAF